MSFLSWKTQTKKENDAESIKRFYGKHNVEEILEVMFN